MPYVRDSFWRGREFTSLAQMQAEAARWSRRSPGSGRAGRWRAPPRPRCSTRSRRTRCGRCRPSRSCWPRGRRRRSARTSTPRSRRCCTRCRGGTSARPPTCASPPPWCSSSSAGSWSSPTPARSAASRPTSATTRRRRSRSTCGPRPGAAGRPPAIGPACEQVIGELLADNALYRLRAAQGVIGLADKHDPARLEAACAKAIAAGDPSYRTVKGILAAGAEREPAARRGRGRRRGGVPARPRLVRERHPHARHDPQRRRPPRPRPGPRHDRRRERTRPTPPDASRHAGRPRAADPRRRRPDRAGRHPGPGRLPRAGRDRHPGPRARRRRRRPAPRQVARLAALAGMRARPRPPPRHDPGLDPRPRQFAGHPVHIFTPVRQEAAS